MQTRTSVQRQLTLVELVALRPAPRALELLEMYAVVILKTLKTSKPGTGLAVSFALTTQAIRLPRALGPQSSRP